MRPFFFIIALLFSIPSYSQYYYNDIIANNQSNKQYLLLKSNKVQKVKAISFDGNNQPSQGFSLEQEFSPDYKKLTTISGTTSGSASTLVTYYENNKVKRSQENARGVETLTDYFYDDKGRIQRINSVTTDTAVQSKSTETHIWTYSDNNQPHLLLKIKNNNDTTRIEMIPDEYGNIGEERWKRKGATPFETYYYYYNNKNQLTDIVRFNKRAQKLLPDFLFEYDTAGRVKQMIQVPAVSSNYMIWSYIYSEKGLKQEEICTDKQKQRLGRIEYSYQ